MAGVISRREVPRARRHRRAALDGSELYAHLNGSDFEAYRATAGRLAALTEKAEVDTLLPAHNEPWVSSDYLEKMRDAFESIVRDETPFVLTDGNREYKFEGFTILTRDSLLTQ